MYNLLSFAALGLALVTKKTKTNVSPSNPNGIPQMRSMIDIKPHLGNDEKVNTVQEKPTKIADLAKSLKQKLFSVDHPDITFENWLIWVQMKTKKLEYPLNESTISIDGKTLIFYRFETLERKTDSLVYDLKMRYFSELVSTDDDNKYIEPYLFPILSGKIGQYGAIPFALYEYIQTRLDRVKSYAPKQANIIRYADELIQELRNVFTSFVGVPVHNWYAVPLNIRGTKYTFIQVMLVNYLWYLLDSELGKQNWVKKFPLPETTNNKRSDNRGLPKVKEDGSSVFLFDSDVLGMMLFQQNIQNKFGKNQVLKSIK